MFVDKQQIVTLEHHKRQPQTLKALPNGWKSWDPLNTQHKSYLHPILLLCVLCALALCVRDNAQ